MCLCLAPDENKREFSHTLIVRIRNEFSQIEIRMSLLELPYALFFFFFLFSEHILMPWFRSRHCCDLCVQLRECVNVKTDPSLNLHVSIWPSSLCISLCLHFKMSHHWSIDHTEIHLLMHLQCSDPFDPSSVSSILSQETDWSLSSFLSAINNWFVAPFARLSSWMQS